MEIFRSGVYKYRKLKKGKESILYFHVRKLKCLVRIPDLKRQFSLLVCRVSREKGKPFCQTKNSPKISHFVHSWKMRKVLLFSRKNAKCLPNKKCENSVTNAKIFWKTKWENATKYRREIINYDVIKSSCRYKTYGFRGNFFSRKQFWRFFFEKSRIFLHFFA